MKNNFKFIWIILGIIFVYAVSIIIINYNKLYGKEKITAVVVKVQEESIIVMETNGGLITVTYPKDIGFKEGQEIIIYDDILEIHTYPAQLSNIEKIKIVKEKSDIEIPDKILRYCYNSSDNIKVNVSELTSEGISLVITDTNKNPYEFSHDYVVNKKEDRWKEVSKISNVTYKSTEEEMTFNMPNMTESEEYNITGRKFNWSKLYGNLGERRI